MTVLAYLLASISLMALIILWFWGVYHDLSQKKQTLKNRSVQMKMYQILYEQARNSPGEQYAHRMLETSQMLWYEAIKTYNHTLKKPFNRLPCFLMGFRSIWEVNKS